MQSGHASGHAPTRHHVFPSRRISRTRRRARTINPIVDVHLAIPPSLAQLCSHSIPTFQLGPKHLRASNSSFALCGFLAHAGHMVASLLCRTTSKTVHWCSGTSVLSPNRDLDPISENERPSITWPVFAFRGSIGSGGEGRTWVSSLEWTSRCGMAASVRVGR